MRLYDSSRDQGVDVTSAIETPASSAKQLQLVELELGRWQSFVEQHAHRSPLHHRQWIELLADHYQLPHQVLGVELHGELLAAVPFLATPTLTGRWRLSSLPFSDCVPLLASSEIARLRLLELLRDYAPFEGFVDVAVRDDREAVTRAQGQVLLRHLVNVEDPDCVQQNIDRRMRQNIRKAQANGLRFEASREARAIEQFFPLQLLTRRKHGVPAQSKRFFHMVHERIVEAGLGYWGLVLSGGRVAAAGLIMEYGHSSLCKYCASDPGLIALRPNHLFFASAILAASRGPSHWFDFGTSRPSDEGLRRFKRHFGGIEQNVYYLQIKGTGRSLRDSYLTRCAGTVLRHSPMWISQYLGQVLYRYSQ